MTLVDEFLRTKPLYDRCAAKVNSLLGELLADAGIKVHHSGFRVKSVESLQGKISRKLNKYNSLRDVTDLIGLRVITYYDDEVDAVASLIEKEFSVDELNSIDKRKAHGPDRFGYMSLHYIASLGAGRCAFPEYRDFSGMKFEIQVRTLLQHAWAEIEHDLGYKSDKEIPFEFRRKFSRVASFLEEADDAFVRIRNGIESYSIESESKIASEDLLIDKITFEIFCRSSKVLRDTDEAVAMAFRSRLNESCATDFIVEFLYYADLKSTALIESALQINAEKVASLARDIQAIYDANGMQVWSEVPLGISLGVLCYLLIYQQGGEEAVLDWTGRFAERFEGETGRLLHAIKKYAP